MAKTRPIAVGAIDRRFAGRIDVGDDHNIGVVEAGREIIEERINSGVAMRLHDGDHLPFCRGTRRAQHGGDFDRMVPVIVEDMHALPFARRREAPLDAAESLRVRPGLIRAHAELIVQPQSPPSH